MPNDAFIDPETGAARTRFTPEPGHQRRVGRACPAPPPPGPPPWTGGARRRWQGARAGRPAGRARVRGRRDLPSADGGQRGAVCGVHLEQVSCSCTAGLPEVGARFKQPRPRPHLPTRSRSEPAPVLPRRDARRDRRRRAQPTGDRTHHAAGAAGVHDAAATCATTTCATSGRPGRLPRLRGFGMAPSSSGGTTVGEALNILEQLRPRRAWTTPHALHHYLEASALAFADRGAYVGDPAYVDVPVRDLLSQKYADERACLIDPEHALTAKPIAAGDVDGVRRRVRRRRSATARSSRTPRGCRRPTSPRRPLGQRGRLHADHRADRRLGHRGAAARVPAQQRAHRLHRGLRRGRPEPDPARQAAAQLDVADDRAPARQAVPGARLARRVDDHHHGAADPGQPDRPRHDDRPRRSPRRGPRSATRAR